MAETIGTAYIQIEPSFQGVNSAISKEMGAAGESGGSSFGAGFAKVMGGTGKVMAGAVAAGGAAVAAMGTAFVGATNSVATYGDNIDKMSQKMGLSAQAYQEWDAVMQHSGTSMETMKASMKTLANAAETGNKAFEELGITEEQLASMNQEQLFEATIAGLQNVEDDTQRTYLAGKLLGRGATELGALLNTSAEDTQAMRDRVRELGGVMSDDAVKAAAAYQDQLQDMQTAFSGLSRNMMSEFLPSVTTVMAGLTEIFSGNTDGGLGMITEGITGIADKVTEALPALLEVGTSILSALGDAIVQNLPTLLSLGVDILNELATGLLNSLPTMIPAIVQFVTSLGTMIIENLPLLIEAATQIILQLALGIAQALPELIPTIIEVVLSIATYLLDNIDVLIDAAAQLMIGLALGLVNAIPVLIEKVPQIIMALLQAFLTAIPKLLEAGKQIIEIIKKAITTYGPQLLTAGQQLMTDLKNKLIEKAKSFIDIGKNIVEGVKKGLSDAWEGLTKWFNDKIGDLVGGVKDLLGIESPSKVFANEVGRWIPAGVAEGIEAGMGVLDKEINTMTSDMISTAINPTIVGSTMTQGVGDASLYDEAGSSNRPVIELLTEIARSVRQPIEVVQNDRGMFEAVRTRNNTIVASTGYHALA
jgi:uncharacterized protein YukE